MALGELENARRNVFVLFVVEFHAEMEISVADIDTLSWNRITR